METNKYKIVIVELLKRLLFMITNNFEIKFQMFNDK